MFTFTTVFLMSLLCSFSGFLVGVAVAGYYLWAQLDAAQAEANVWKQRHDIVTATANINDYSKQITAQQKAAAMKSAAD